MESCALALPVLSVPSCDAEVVTAAPLAVKTCGVTLVMDVMFWFPIGREPIR
ncbi:hypothetical protein Rmet_6528 [Cupriavidus metallidurans CH34]|uniref:Uncharacterized protein n=1 Tax=Cupriavidus metallidurans (strain ATCC 43123 / DSM 2839 / NBRC 102507 / CH34) TaxID=266264 RepID=D3DXW5_CUPMC|nr:hypothetical protein Rmet_6528 [Cupriavidus metallidurans CH34]